MRAFETFRFAEFVNNAIKTRCRKFGGSTNIFMEDKFDKICPE